MLNLAVNQRAQYLDNDGKPLSLGRVTYYDVGTTTPKSVYADPNALIELTNPLELDIGGFVPVSGVFYGEGNYTILVEKCINPESPIGERVYDEEYTIPDVPGTIISDVMASSTTFINAVEDIPNLAPGEFTFVYCQQYYNDLNRDSGGGWFRWFPSSTATPDLGSIFSTTGSPAIGRYIRIYPEAKVKTSYYGVVANKNVSMVSRIQSAATYALANRMELELSTGWIQCSGDFTVNANKVVIEDGFRIVRLEALIATSMLINCTDIDVQTSTKFVSEAGEPFGPSLLTINSSTPFEIKPEWWGADASGTNDSWGAFFRASESSVLSSSPIVVDGTYVLTAAGAVVQPEATFPSLKVTKGSWIQTTYPKIIFGEVEKDSTDIWVIRTPNDTLHQYIGSVTGSVEASVVFPATMAASFYERVMSDIQDVKTKPVSIYWDSPRGQAWEIQGSMLDDDLASLAYHYLSNGNYLKLAGTSGTTASFGRIKTLTDCLDTAYAAPKSMLGETFHLSWWRVNYGTLPATSAQVLRKSIIAAAINNNDTLAACGVLDLDGLTVNSDSIGTINLDNSSLKIVNGSIFGTSKIASIQNADRLELQGIVAAIDCQNVNVIKVDGVTGLFYNDSMEYSGDDLAITGSDLSCSSGIVLTGNLSFSVKGNKLQAKNTLTSTLCPGAIFSENSVFITETKLVEYFRHVDFRNVSQSQVINNQFKAGTAIGASVPTSNLGFIWITGAGSSSVVLGFAMHGNQMIDSTNIKSVIPAYPYTWIAEMAWITQNNLAVDGHVADVYDNYGNIYTGADANGNIRAAQLIPGTRCYVPRVYVGVGNEAIVHFILPRKILGLGGDPNLSYPSVFKFSSGPNTVWGGADLKPATVQPPTTTNPPFTAKIRNDNLVYQINAEIWVNSGMGNQAYLA